MYTYNVNQNPGIKQVTVKAQLNPYAPKLEALEPAILLPAVREVDNDPTHEYQEA